MIALLDTSDTLEKCREDFNGEVEVGQLITPLTRRSNLGVTFAIDNGAFSSFDPAGFRTLLRRDKPHIKKCKFVAIPDVVGSARRTLEVFSHWEPEVACMGWPIALVAQDGIENMTIPWGEIDAVFIGGTTRWKTSDHAFAVAKAAIAVEKWVHIGRCNSDARYDAWEDIANSFDGTGVGRYSHMRKSKVEPTLFKNKNDTGVCSLCEGNGWLDGEYAEPCPKCNPDGIVRKLAGEIR